jgi:hypothetical protein
MASSVDALDLPIQFFALGTAVGMLAALILYHRTGELEHWPVYVAYPALALLSLGLLLTLLTAIP